MIFGFFSTVPGSKKLAVPKVSTTFRWSGSEVASIANQVALYMKSLLKIPDGDSSSESEVLLLLKMYIEFVSYIGCL